MTIEITEAMVDAACPQISEGLGAYLRKFADSDAAKRARHYLHQMPKSEWSGMIRMLAEEAVRAALAARPAPEAGSVVERLRDFADEVEQTELSRGFDYDYDDEGREHTKEGATRKKSEILEAADLIEAQAAQIASLSAKVAEVERERDEKIARAMAKADHEAERAGDIENENDALLARASELQREVERLRAAIDDALGRHQVTHIHAGLRAALQQEGESDV